MSKNMVWNYLLESCMLLNVGAPTDCISLVLLSCHGFKSCSAVFWCQLQRPSRCFFTSLFQKKKKRFMAIISLLWWINTTIQRIAKAYRHYSESHVMNKVNYVEKKLQNADAGKSNLILCIKKCYLKSEFVHPLCNRQSLLSILKLK